MVCDIHFRPLFYSMSNYPLSDPFALKLLLEHLQFAEEDIVINIRALEPPLTL